VPLPKPLSLPELQRLRGPYPWRTDWIEASSSKILTEEMKILLALVIFDGWELFPGTKASESDD
jgi:hypothetical protein